MIDVSKISVGDVYKSYPKLCKAISEKPKSSGRGKEYHLQEISRHIKFEVENGRHYKIVLIYNEPIGKEVKSRLPYMPELQKLVLHMLVNKRDDNKNVCRTNITKNEALKVLNLLNNNYFNCNDKRKEVAEYFDADLNHIDEIFDRTKENLISNFESALTALSKKNTIHWMDTFMITQYKKEETPTLVRKDGGYVEEFRLIKNESRVATFDEVVIIKASKIKASEELGYVNEFEARINGDIDKFYEIVNDYLFKEIGVVYEYATYSIGFKKEIVDKLVDKYTLGDNEYREKVKLMTEKILINEEKNAIKRVNDTKNKKIKLEEEWGGIEIDDNDFKEKKKFRFDECYVEKDMKVKSSIIGKQKEDLSRKIKG